MEKIRIIFSILLYFILVYWKVVWTLSEKIHFGPWHLKTCNLTQVFSFPLSLSLPTLQTKTVMYLLRYSKMLIWD